MGIKHIGVAVNPAASFGRQARAGDLVIETLQSRGYKTTRFQNASYVLLEEQLKRAYNDSENVPDALIVVGGDGMVHLAANILAESGIPFGVYPSGTGNDFAEVLGIPMKEPQAALEWMLAGIEAPRKRVDAIRILHRNDRIEWCAASVSGGFDARVNERANLLRWPKGKARYNLAILLELMSLKPLNYRLRIDGADWRDFRGMLVSVSNIGQFGGGMRITPDSVIYDGILELLLLEPLGRLAFLRIFPKVYRGTHTTDPRVRIIKMKTVEIESSEAIAYGDGERLGNFPLRCEVVSGALQVIAPSE